MTPPEEFETNLKEVVNAKRLSASKMNALTELALKNMEHDTQLVSILYRTHKSLPSVTSKISSLYIFDALSRAAKSYATKHNLSGEIYTQTGNAATFLQKVGGVVEGLFQDMIGSGNPEAKEKTKKILDIWVKGNTFPPAILSQLLEIFKGMDKVPDSKSTSTADPRVSSAQATHAFPVQAPPGPEINNSPVQDPQATLLALLTQAAANTTNLSSLQTTTGIGIAAPQLGATQLAVIQQLAHTAASVPSQSLTPPEPVNVQKFSSSSSVNGSSLSLPPYRDEHRTMVRGEQRYSGYRSPESESHFQPHFDNHDNMRGRFRGGFRNRGRGDRMGRNWDDRDRDYRDSERDARSLHKFRGRSRSRSPARTGERKGSRPRSPPRKPQPVSSHSLQHDPSSKRHEPGKDEFGRDIRPESPKSPTVTQIPSPPQSTTPPRSTPPVDPRIPPSVTDIQHSNVEKSVMASVTANTSSSTTTTVLVTNSASPELGMESFNPATFDYTSPASWEVLGKMWQVTNGYLPSTEQLMQFVISYGTGQQVDSNLQPLSQEYKQEISIPSFRGRGRGRGGNFRDHGGTTYGNGRSIREGYDDSAQATDAIVLGGGDAEDGSHPEVDGAQDYTISTEQGQGRTVGPGHMQKVGDKWLFVRGMAMDVS